MALTASPTAPDAPQQDGGAAYICPMCPGVESEGPAACPKCGMALEPALPAAPGVGAGAAPNPELLDMTLRLRNSLALSIPLLAVAMGDMLPGRPMEALFGAGLRGWVEALLATPVVLWGGWPFFKRGWASLVGRSLNMFTLIALGTGMAYGYSLAAVAAPGIFPEAFRGPGGRVGLYFESAAVIVTLVLLGQVLELRARGRTSQALQALLGLAPRTARRLSPCGHEAEVPLERVAVGDRLRVRPGETVPVDGIILEGRSALDESLVTGEPMPVEKGPGEAVTGGTLNGTGGFVMRAERVGADTLLARIVRMVAEAQRSRAPIQRLADRVAGYFVPAVVGVAVLSFLAWAAWGPAPALAYALVNAVAVLIIACPCALGLATPMSIMVGMGRGAGMGVLIRNAEALETLERVDTLVVDKTGTLTEGRPRLAEVVPAPGFRAEEVLGLAAGLERGSEHPLAAAILEGARDRGLEPAELRGFEARAGQGILGTVAGRRVALGNAGLLAELGLEVSGLLAKAEHLRGLGATVVFVALDGRPAGLIAVEDRIKETTPEALEALRAEGLEIVLLTGDSRSTAEAVARRLGIARVEAEVLPARKGEVVRALQERGRVVAMAGDGINDAPALARAQVGIAMGTGADVAMESAGVTLVRGDLRGIVRARRLSRATMRNIRQNLFWAFAYNTLGVPIAAGVLYPVFGLLLSPMIAAAAMSFSSVSVIGNALRLRRVRL